MSWTPGGASSPSRSGGQIGTGIIQYADGTTAEKQIYLKTIHLLDPFMYLNGEYEDELVNPMELPEVGAIDNSRRRKLLDSNNKAYVDVTASSILSRLRENGLIQHAVHIYGAVCGVQDSYLYDITEEYDTLRNKTWFWGSAGISGEHIRVVPTEGEDPLDKDVLEYVMSPPAEVLAEIDREDAEEDEVAGFTGDDDICELEAPDISEVPLDMEVEDVMDSLVFEEADDAATDATDATDDTLLYKIFLECADMPVMLLFEEAADGVMDNLLKEDMEREDSLAKDETRAGIRAFEAFQEEKEARWSAWIMQVVCGLVQMQGLLGLCHNDLHTYNITWTHTDAEHLLYVASDGRSWKVPTYGKLFQIIDFGRATFSVGAREFISDDFFEENEAHGQYNYGACYDEGQEVIKPNPSFDLCRLSVSMVADLYNDTPTVRGGKKKRKAIFREGSWVKYYTTSALYNMMWKWLVDVNGMNVFINKDGSDKYPGFDLYVHIARYIKGAIPIEQLKDDTFWRYHHTSSVLPEGKYIEVALYV